MQIIAYFLILIVAAAISLTLSSFSWRRRPAAAATSLAVLMFFVTLWILAQTFQDLCSSPLMKMFWYNIKFLGITVVPVAWLSLTLKYSRHEKLLTPRYMLAILVIPLITNLMIWTNKFFKLFLTDVEFKTKKTLPVVTIKEGIWFWVHTYYSYLLIALGIILIFSCLFRLSKDYRNQTLTLLTGVSIPLIANILTVFKLIKTPYSDITPFAFLLTGILFFWSLFRYKLLDIVPIARHAIFENMKDIILVLDTQKRIVDLNPAALSAIGMKSWKIIGKPFTEVLSKWSNIIEKFEDTLETNEKIVINRVDIKKYFDLRISPIYNSKGKLTGRLIVLRDITDLEEAMEALESSREIAEAASKAKSQFLATMSHEIRTPMNAIIGMSDLLGSTELIQEQREYLEMIQLSADSLLSIINDILDFSKIEAGKLDLEMIDFGIKSLIDDIVKALSVQAMKKYLKLIYHFEDGIPDILIGDPVRLKQIVINLIGNSLKFTSEGTVEVKIEKSMQEDNLISLKFSVMDTGIGIPENKIENLFQLFSQLDNTTTRKFGGTGLGLSIVKSLVELMGGTIEVKSKLGIGSNFSFTMPFQISNCINLSVKQESASSSESIEKNVSILLAEDNKVNQMLMIKMLEKKGWQIEVADNGRIALEKLAINNSYNLVLMDIQMPEMDGFEAASSIRETESVTGMHIPIIALTANAMKGDKEKCIEAGMDDYLSKPIKSTNLYEMVMKYVK